MSVGEVSPWWETTPEGEEIVVGLVKLDRAGSTREWDLLPEEEVVARRGRYYAGVEDIAHTFGAVEPVSWQGDGAMLFLRRDGEHPAATAFLCAEALWQRTKLDLGLDVRLACHVAAVRWVGDTGKLASRDIDLCGHLEHATPPGVVGVSEDVALLLPSLQPRFKDQVAAAGVAVRDDQPLFVFPGSAAAKVDRERVRESAELTVSQRLRSYVLGPDVAKLRYVGFRLRKAEPPCLDVRSVFEPLSVDRRSRPLGEEPPAGLEGLKAIPWAALSAGLPAGGPAVPFAQAFRDSRHLVVLGAPGSGKTTLVRWLAVVAAQGRAAVGDALGTRERLLPVPVSIGRLADLRRELGQSVSVIEVIARYLASRHAGDAGELTSVLPEVLERGGALVLLDGLDEVAGGERDDIRRWMETLVAAFPRSRFIVTSRPVGYVGFVAAGAAEIELRPFTKEQVTRYLHAFARAYRTWELGHPDDAGADSEANSLKQAINADERLSSLAKNPFLLSAIALVHRAEGRLPRHRVQLYETFAQTLCETWGSARRLVSESAGEPALRYEEEALPILGTLALRMQDEHPSGAAPEEFVLDVLSRTLVDEGRAGTKEARAAARQFLHKAGKDVQILVERGAGAWGFLHLTFQEFFAAAGLHARDQFEAVAMEHLFSPRWREVLRLGVGYLALVQKRPAATARFIESVLAAKREGTDRYLTEVLQFQVPLALELAIEAGEALPLALQERVVQRFAEWATTMRDHATWRHLLKASQSDLWPAVAERVRERLDPETCPGKVFAQVLLDVTPIEHVVEMIASGVEGQEVSEALVVFGDQRTANQLLEKLCQADEDPGMRLASTLSSYFPDIELPDPWAQRKDEAIAGSWFMVELVRFGLSEQTAYEIKKGLMSPEKKKDLLLQAILTPMDCLMHGSEEMAYLSAVFLTSLGPDETLRAATSGPYADIAWMALARRGATDAVEPLLDRLKTETVPRKRHAILWALHELTGRAD